MAAAQGTGARPHPQRTGARHYGTHVCLWRGLLQVQWNLVGPTEPPEEQQTDRSKAAGGVASTLAGYRPFTPQAPSLHGENHRLGAAHLCCTWPTPPCSCSLWPCPAAAGRVRVVPGKRRVVGERGLGQVACASGAGPRVRSPGGLGKSQGYGQLGSVAEVYRALAAVHSPSSALWVCVLGPRLPVGYQLCVPNAATEHVPLRTEDVLSWPLTGVRTQEGQCYKGQVGSIFCLPLP